MIDTCISTFPALLRVHIRIWSTHNDYLIWLGFNICVIYVWKISRFLPEPNDMTNELIKEVF